MTPVIYVSIFMSLLQPCGAQPAGLVARAVLTAQRTCHDDNEDYEELKMDIFLTNTGVQPIVLCDRRSYVSVTPSLAKTAENARAKHFVYQPNIDVFPDGAEVAKENALVRTCQKTLVAAKGTVLVKRGEVSQLSGLHEVPATRSMSGRVYFTGDVSIRLPGAHLVEWKSIPLDPLLIVLPSDTFDTRPYVSRRNRCEAWRIANNGGLVQ